MKFFEVAKRALLLMKLYYSIQNQAKNNHAEAIKKFDQAMEKATGENPSTKDLEKWFAEHL